MVVLNAGVDSAKFVRTHILTRLCCLQFIMHASPVCFEIHDAHFQSAALLLPLGLAFSGLDKCYKQSVMSFHPCFSLTALGTRATHTLQRELRGAQALHFLSNASALVIMLMQV